MSGVTGSVETGVPASTELGFSDEEAMAPMTSLGNSHNMNLGRLSPDLGLGLSWIQSITLCTSHGAELNGWGWLRSDPTSTAIIRRNV